MAENKLHLDKAPRVTITSICTWNEDTCKWIPKAKKDLSETLQACVAAAKTKDYSGDLQFGGRKPTSEELAPYKALPLSSKSTNLQIAAYFKKGGTPSIGSLYRAQKNADHLNDVLKTFYWLTAKGLRDTVADYNQQLEAAAINSWHFLKELKMKPKPKKLSKSEIANYLVSRGVDGGEYDAYSEDIDRIEKNIAKRTS